MSWIDVVDGLGERVEELENSCVGPLVLAEGFVIHEEIAGESVAVDLVDPLCESLGAEWPFLPCAIRKSERDVVAEAVVLQQQLHATILNRTAIRFARWWNVDVVGRAEAEQSIDALADDRLMLPARGDVMREFVRVDEFRVAENLWHDAEDFLHLLLMHGDLRVELLLRKEKRRRVMAGLADEFARTGVDELLQCVDDIRRPALQLFERGARDGVGATEATIVTLHEVEHLQCGWSIALVCNLAQDLFVRRIVEVKRIVREDGVAAQSPRLMQLKVETDACHRRQRSATLSRMSDLVVLAVPRDESRNTNFNSGGGSIAHVLLERLYIRHRVRHIALLKRQ